MVPAKCGVGKLNATICAQMLRDPNKSEAIAFSSVAEGLVRINVGLEDIEDLREDIDRALGAAGF